MNETDLHEALPPTPDASPRPREKRLVMRVHEIWRQARGEAMLPLLGTITPADCGEDAPHIFMIDLTPAAGPSFTAIGAALRIGHWPWEEAPLVAECPDDSVLGSVSRHWPEIVERGVPVTRGGAGVNDGGPVLYRGILMPLGDASGRIVAIMGAANWRAVDESHDAPRA
jgi:hypothetical protein